MPQNNLSLLRTCDAHPTVFMSLAAYRPSRLLLPNLHTFHCTGCIAGLLPAIQGFIGHKLVHVTVNAKHMYDEHNFLHPINTLDLDSLFSSLPRLSPFIQYLEFMINGGMAAPPVFFDMLGNLHHLVALTMNTETPATVLNHLAGLPSLQILNSAILSRSNIHIFTTKGNPFSNLKYFLFYTDIVSTPSSSIITMLNSMQCRFFQLEGSFRECFRSLTETESLIAALHHHPCRTSLRYLRLSFIHPPGIPSTSLLTIEIFRPLFSFTALTSVTIIPVVLDDSWLKEIAQAWPNLERLTVPACAAQRPRVTLEGIIPLINHCPRLCDLRITINAHPITPTKLDGIHNNHIKHISLDHSTVTLPRKVFRSLIRMFPYLVALTFCEARRLYTAGEGLVYINGWGEINSLLRETH